MSQHSQKTKTVSENITDCPSCNEEFSRTTPPITLPCGHNLCKPCILQHRRRNGIVKCPIDHIDRKLQSLQINVDFLDLLELLKEEKIEIPKKRRGISSQATQCDTMKPEENYGELLAELEKKREYLEGMVQRFDQIYKHAEAQAKYEIHFPVDSMSNQFWCYPYSK